MVEKQRWKGRAREVTLVRFLIDLELRVFAFSYVCTADPAWLIRCEVLFCDNCDFVMVVVVADNGCSENVHRWYLSLTLPSEDFFLLDELPALFAGTCRGCDDAFTIVLMIYRGSVAVRSTTDL